MNTLINFVTTFLENDGKQMIVRSVVLKIYLYMPGFRFSLSPYINRLLAITLEIVTYLLNKNAQMEYYL